jgi:Dihydrodipicolinate synthetase family
MNTTTTAAPGIPGIWPALMTPLDASLAIDHATFAAHSKALLAAGCGGVTPFGTTGEGPSFSVAERIAAVDALVAGGVSASRILVSVSCAALPDTIALTQHAQRIGAWGVLLMPPFFFKGVSDAGIVDSYRQVLDAVPDPALRVVLYHIPQVSGVALSHAVIGELPSCRLTCPAWACTWATSWTCRRWHGAAVAARSAAWPTSCRAWCTAWPASPIRCSQPQTARASSTCWRGSAATR